MGSLILKSSTKTGRFRRKYYSDRLEIIMNKTSVLFFRAKRPRRSPSPIIYNTTSTYRDRRHRSPTRHKHKKRKKSKYSSSRSRSRSRSRERRTSKKGYRNRSRTPGGYKDYHHKKSYSSSAPDRRKSQKDRNYS